MTPATKHDNDSAPPAAWDMHPWKRWALNVVLVVHLGALLLMVGSSGSGTYASPPLIVRAATFTGPYVRFTGMQNGYRFFAPDPGPATILWFRLNYENGAVRWGESPSRGRTQGSLAYQREFYPAMMLGMQTASPGTPIVEGYPHLTEIGLTYASSYARHLAASWNKVGEEAMVAKVRTVQIFIVTHAIRTPTQVRMNWSADDLRLYQAVDLGEFDAEGTPMGAAVSMGHQRPPILGLVERMLQDLTGPEGETINAAFPAPFRALLMRFPELRRLDENRPLQARIAQAITSRDYQEKESEGISP